MNRGAAWVAAIVFLAGCHASSREENRPNQPTTAESAPSPQAELIESAKAASLIVPPPKTMHEKESLRRFKNGEPIGWCCSEVGTHSIVSLRTYRDKLSPQSRNYYAEQCLTMGTEMSSLHDPAYHFASITAFGCLETAYNFATDSKIKGKAVRLFYENERRALAKWKADSQAKLEAARREGRFIGVGRHDAHWLLNWDTITDPSAPIRNHQIVEDDLGSLMR